MPAPATAKKGPQREGRIEGLFTGAPQFLTERLLTSLSAPSVCLCFLVLDRTIGGPPSEHREACQTTEPELARLLRMTDRGVRDLIREAESCIHDDKKDRSKRVGVLQVRPTARGIELAFNFEAVSKLRSLRPLNKLADAQERAARKVQAMAAELTCPVGQVCPVKEVYLDGRVTNIAPAGVRIVGNTAAASAPLPPQVGTPVPGSDNGKAGGPAPSSPPVAKGRRLAAAPSHGQVGTPVPGSALLDQLRNLLESTLATQLHKLPDAAMLWEIVASLGSATVEDLGASIAANLPRIRSYKFVALLARDAGDLAKRAPALPCSIEELRQNLARVTGDEALAAARLMLAHPGCADRDRRAIYAWFPGLRTEGREMFEHP